MSKSCPRCGGRMERGFVPEARDVSTRVETWFEGEPQKRWGTLKFKGLRRFEIQTWRCARCACLESYAPEQPNGE